MTLREEVAQAVRHCYGELDVNCARTTLHTLSARTGITLSPQLWAAATGMHGAGRFGAQCGLVEGMLLLLGVLGEQAGLDAKAVSTLCHAYAEAFTARFGALECRVLRPGGFKPEDPPHVCEVLTVDALVFAVGFLDRQPALMPVGNPS